jgi:hypothetical protein
MEHTHLLKPSRKGQLHSIHMCRENELKPKFTRRGVTSVMCSGKEYRRVVCALCSASRTIVKYIIFVAAGRRGEEGNVDLDGRTPCTPWCSRWRRRGGAGREGGEQGEGDPSLQTWFSDAAKEWTGRRAAGVFRQEQTTRPPAATADCRRAISALLRRVLWPTPPRPWKMTEVLQKDESQTDGQNGPNGPPRPVRLVTM